MKLIKICFISCICLFLINSSCKHYKKDCEGVVNSMSDQADDKPSNNALQNAKSLCEVNMKAACSEADFDLLISKVIVNQKSNREAANEAFSKLAPQCQQASNMFFSQLRNNVPVSSPHKNGTPGSAFGAPHAGNTPEGTPGFPGFFNPSNGMGGAPGAEHSFPGFFNPNNGMGGAPGAGHALPGFFGPGNAPGSKQCTDVVARMLTQKLPPHIPPAVIPPAAQQICTSFPFSCSQEESTKVLQAFTDGATPELLQNRGLSPNCIEDVNRILVALSQPSRF